MQRSQQLGSNCGELDVQSNAISTESSSPSYQSLITILEIPDIRLCLKLQSLTDQGLITFKASKITHITTLHDIALPANLGPEDPNRRKQVILEVKMLLRDTILYDNRVNNIWVVKN